MRNWTVRSQLLASFSLIIVIFLGTSLYSILITRGIESALVANSQQNSVIQRIGINFRGSVHDRAIALRDVILASDAAALDAQAAIIDKLAAFYAQSGRELAAMQSQNLPAEVGQMAADIARVEASTVELTQKILAHVRAGEREAAQALLPQARAGYEQWLAAINRLIDFEEQRISANNTDAQAAATSLSVTMLLLTLLAAGVGLGAALFTAGAIVRQLGAEPQTVRAVVLAMQGGDLTAPVAVQVGDTSSVMAAVRDMQQRFHELVAQVHGNVRQLDATSADLESGYNSLGQRTQQANESLEQTASSMEQLTGTVHQSADSARQAHSLSGNAADAANAGGRVMEQVVHTMQEIEASSKKINDIISVIDGIAFQTNILALNAAVEAARAGEQGRGFAVVAAEVRSLAQRSAAAAKEIAQLIQTSVDKIGSGSVQVAQAGQAMQDIVGHVQSVSAIMGELSTAAAEQSQGISRVNNAVAQLDQMTQQNTGLVEQSGHSVQQLRVQARQLAEAVAQFRINAHTAAMAAAPVMRPVALTQEPLRLQ